MRKVVFLIISICFLCSVAWAERPLSKEECRVIVKDLESMSNLNPRDIEAKGREALEQLRNGETLTSYFVAFNIYVENLFNHGKIDEAQKAIKQMLEEAADQSDVECKVIALRTEGQFYYKLGLYDRAADCFRNAMKVCPRYDSDKLEHCFTWSSTLFWLVQSDIRVGKVEEADYWIRQMDDMMDWLEANGDIDTVGYKPVMIRGLKAKIELLQGNRDAAVALLQECPQYMRPDIPARAYVEYYVATLQLCLLDDKHAEALPLLDQLIEMHISDFKPIAAEYLYQKGISLARLQRFEESAQTLLEYIELKDLVDDTSLAQQLEELSTRYEVEKLQHERDNMQKRLAIVIAVCIALIIIISLIVVSQKRLRHKNKTLAHSISELNRLARETAATSALTDTPNPEASASELQTTGSTVIEYINSSKCYLRPDCGRDTIKEALGVPERMLGKAIVAVTGASLINYINQLRLKASIEMLDDRPEMTINDISTACGFGTVRQFQRIFKQHYDMSPSAYRDARRSTSPGAANP